MNKKRVRTLKEIKELIKEPKHDYIEKFANISDDKKSLLLRVPQEIRKHFKIKVGDKLRFYAEFEEDKKPRLDIKLIRKNDR